jgi:hypothetical protein
MNRLRLIVVLLLALAGTPGAESVVHAAAYAYDNADAGCVNVGVGGRTWPVSVLAEVPEDDAARRAVDASASTAPDSGSVATNNVKSILDSLPKGNQSDVRTVDSDAALQALFDQLSAGGTPLVRPSYDGQWYQLDDGCQVGIRNASKSGGRTIDVRSPDGRTWKVHIT